MTRMKLMVAAAATLAALAGTDGAFAQVGPGPGPGPGVGPGPGMGAGGGKMGGQGKKPMPTAEDRLRRLDANLGLSDAQKAEIRPIVEEEAKELEALQDDTSLTRIQKRDRMHELRGRYHDRIRAHLGPEQQKKADALREKASKRREMRREIRKERMQERMPEMPKQPQEKP